QQFFGARLGVKPNCAFAVVPLRQNLGSQPRAKNDLIASPDALSGPDEHIPGDLVRIQRANQEYFNLRSRIRIAMAVQPRRKNSSVVQDQAITRMKIATEVLKHIVPERLFFPRKNQHPRSAALG